MNSLLPRNTKRTPSFLALLLLVALLSSASLTHRSLGQEQEPPSDSPGVDKAELHQALLDLTNTATVMCVAAHPDDEDGSTLTILRRKYGVHTVTLFSTYGEGGQNGVGPELYEELGVIRARETLAAAQIQGSQAHFLGLKDFGFSKSAAEAFRVWNHNEALRRMVFKLRELRPDVIITNHDTKTGHGHHQATGQLIIEAFTAAADPQRFPEQLSRVSIWQAQRLFVRSRPPAASTATTPVAKPPAEKLVSNDPNEIDPIRGTMYAEQALAALQKHASQGPWPASIAERLRGSATGKLPLIRYRLEREAPGAPALPADAKTLLDGLPATSQQALPTIDGRALTEIVDQPDRVLNALIDWRRRERNSPENANDRQRSRLFHERVDRTLAVAAKVKVQISARDTFLIRGTPAAFAVNISNEGNRTVQVKKLSFTGWGDEVPLDPAEQLIADTETSTPVDLITPPLAAITTPPSEHLYDEMLFGHPFVTQAELEIDGAKFSIKEEQRFDVAPAVEITRVSPSPCVRTEQTLLQCDSLQVSVTNHGAKPFFGLLAVTTRQGQHGRTLEKPLKLEPGQTLNDSVLQARGTPHQEIWERQQSAEVRVAINAPPVGELISEREIDVVYVNANVAKELRVGYLPSFDQTLKHSLESLGVKAQELNVADIKDELVSRFETIIIDNRGYYAHPELIAVNSLLLKYVEEGGTLIVFYHKDSEWNPNERGRPQLAPYPIILGDERVTDETAPIRFTNRRHRLLNYPNKIRSSDFGNWIQERGLYYPKEWDPHYTTIFSTNDKGEKALRGGLLVARHGRGNYIFTSMVWYRQLAAGVPGAYQMFANMISYGK